MDILVKIADLITLISDLPTDKVIIARDNYLQSNFKDDIAIVELLTAPTIATSDSYDGLLEELTYRTLYKATVTIDFYGDNSLSTANKTIALLRSQKSHEFKRDNEIEVFRNKSLTDVKNLQGTTNYNRYQLEFVVKYYEEFVDNVLRIDTAQIVVNTDNEKQFTITNKI